MRISDWSSDVCSSDLVMNIIGDVKGRRCILVDDIVDSAGTLCNAAVALRDAGATAVSAYVTHGVLSGGAVARVSSSPLEELVMTDSIQATEAVRVAQNIRQISIAPLIGDRSEEHTSELQSLMRISYAVFCLKKK